MRFVDEAKIFVKGGDGGNGCTSMRREKYVPRGGPNGGDGGKGGDIIFVTDPGMSTLLDFKYTRHFKADRGIHGQGNDRHGHAGADRIVKVPVGTVLKDFATGEILYDLDTPGRSVVIAKGGKGGRGNARFLSNRNRAPTNHEDGDEGEEKILLMELKLLADVGLIGLPNAGKSTLLSRISKAHPKIADYPFTTTAPALGVVPWKDHRSCTVADLPGLIEGASQGHGMGIQFLKHVERTKGLLHLIDLSQCDDDGWNVPYEMIRKELGSYSAALLKLPEAVVLTKTDLTGQTAASRRAKKYFEGKGIKCVAISAATGKGLDSLLAILFKDLLVSADKS